METSVKKKSSNIMIECISSRVYALKFMGYIERDKASRAFGSKGTMTILYAPVVDNCQVGCKHKSSCIQFGRTISFITRQLLVMLDVKC